MTPDDVRILFGYNYWARDRVLAAMHDMTEVDYTRPNGFTYGSIRGILRHCLDVECTWRCRLVGEQLAPITEEDVASPALLRARWLEEESRMRRIRGPTEQRSPTGSPFVACGMGPR